MNEGYWDHIAEAYDNGFCTCADRAAWLALPGTHSQWKCHLIAAHWLLAEVDNGGLMQFFLNDSGYVAPEAVAAFQRIGLPEAARAVSAAMSVFGLEYPLDCTVRDSILRGKMGLSPEAKDNALFKSGLFDQMEESLRRAGGGTFDGLYAQMDEYAERKSTEPCAPPNGGPVTPVGNSGVAEGPPSVS
jgi:hypothetical protein